MLKNVLTLVTAACLAGGAAPAAQATDAGPPTSPRRVKKLEKVGPKAGSDRKVIEVPEIKRSQGPPAQLKPDAQAPGETIPPPPDAATIPDDAERMENGVVYRVLQKGWGDVHPTGNDVIAIHYNGWLQDGRLFDTTANRRDPREVQVNRAGGGLADLFTDMIAGEQRRVWIPESLADAYRPSELKGHVVFDLSLVDVDEAPPVPPSCAEPPAEAETSLSGLSQLKLHDGRGDEKPGESDIVLVHLDAWGRDGILRASTNRGNPSPRSFHVDRMIAGFREAVLEMRVGEKRRVWVPGHLAGAGDGASGAPQTAELELISFIQNPNRATGWVDQPQDAARTESGLAYQVTRAGTGDARPAEGMTVVVHYTAWSRDGGVVDSSYGQGKPVAMPLNQDVPSGLREALTQMVEGEKRRVWLPPELGFVKAKNVPDGPLYFELDLIAIR